MNGMRKTEDHHHTAENVGQYVRQAVKLADNANLSDADRASLLPVIVTLLSAKQVFYEQAVPAGMLLPQGARR